MEPPASLAAQAHAPFHDLLGIRVTHGEEGLVHLLCTPGPMHANHSGILHGGVMPALLDQANAFAGLCCPHPGRRRHAVTLDLDTRFTGQGRLGAPLIAFGASPHRYRSGGAAGEGAPDAP